MKHDLQSRQHLCDALNKLFWKCPMPKWMQEGGYTVNDWAEYWLGELRNMPGDKAVTGIKWRAKDSLFVPCRGWRKV